MKVLIIGSGIAGMSCAVESASLGNKVIMVSPLQSERSQSVLAAGGINASLDTLGQNDDYLQHAEDTLKGGCYIENPETIKAFCKSAVDNVKWLDDMGVVFSRDDNMNIALRAFGGQSKMRTAYAGTSTGKQIVTALVMKCREYEIKGLIERKLGFDFYSALIANDVCYGALLCNRESGKLEAVYADSLVMASGGQNRIFGTNTTGTVLCDGYAAAKLFTQGVKLRNLEFIQYHPTGIETDMKMVLVSEAARAEGGRLYYMDGDKKVYFMEDKYGEKGNLVARDIVSKEMFACKRQVYLDISFLGKDVIMKKLEEVYDLCMTYIGLDVTKDPIPVSPAVHFFMGGLKVDDNHQTNIRNLYAIGECASKYHGANRLGGNSLLAAVHSGRVSAKAIALGSTIESADFTDYINSEEKILDDLKKNHLSHSQYYLNDLAEITNKCLGIVRDESSLKEGLAKLEAIMNLSGDALEDTNIRAYERYRRESILVLAKAIMLSALERRETRGSQIRSDYPESDDNFKKSSVASYNNGQIEISFVDETKEA